MEGRDELLTRFMAEAEEAGWWRPGVTAAAAVSGGPDSMALLHLLWQMSKEKPMNVIAAHVNHRFRAAESAAEAEMVAGACRSWGIPLETAVMDLPAYIEETGMNAQAAAREKRYAFLKQTAAAHGAELLLLGHHADDQAETVLMRILRGTGVGGLAGIPFRRQEENLELIRPLLRITKKELLLYCRRNGVPYAVDSSNFSRKYFRNAVRLDLIPELKKINPRLEEALIRLADLAAADDDCLEKEAAGLFESLTIRAGEGFLVDRRRFAALHVALQRRLIKLILKYSSGPWLSLEYRQIEELLEAMADERKAVNRIDIGGGWTFSREYDEVYMGPPRQGQGGYRHPVEEIPAAIRLDPGGRIFEIERLEPSVTLLPDHRWEAFFDESELAMPLCVRTRQPGDRMLPDGLNGTKKVQDMFVDAKVPRSQRDAWPLLADREGRILWIPGLRRSRLARVGPRTKSIIRVCVRPENGRPESGRHE